MIDMVGVGVVVLFVLGGVVCVVFLMVVVFLVVSLSFSVRMRSLFKYCILFYFCCGDIEVIGLFFWIE